MGAFSGNLTYKQYYVTDSLPEDWKTSFQQSIEGNTFRPLTAESESERAFGWCSPHFPLDLVLDSGVYLYNEYITLSVRIDSWSVPASTLRIYAEAEARRVMSDQNRTTISRYERSEIRERVKMDLRRKTLPSIKTVDMVWNWQDGRVRFFSSSQRLNLEFMDLFEATFGRSLLPDGPFSVCQVEGFGLEANAKDRVEHLDPLAFVDRNTAAEALGEIR
jgi:hypothetical protein